MSIQEKLKIMKDNQETQRKRKHAENKDKSRKRAKVAMDNRHRNDPTHRVNQSMKAQICRSLKTGNDLSWQEYVGYTLAELRAHLESLWRIRMSWNNYGSEIGKWVMAHHITGIHYFYASKHAKDFKEFWSLDNMYPEWREIIVKKQSKIE